MHAFVELHIEQGGFLEADNLDIGIVEGIVGINWWTITVEGMAKPWRYDPHARPTRLSGSGIKNGRGN